MPEVQQNQVSNLELDYEPRFLGDLSRISHILKEQSEHYRLNVPFPIAARDGKLWIKDREIYFLAAKCLGIETVPCILIDDERIFDQRRMSGLVDPSFESPLEVAYRLRAYMKRYGIGSQAALAREFNCTEATISHYLSLTQQIYPEVQTQYIEGLRLADASRTFAYNEKAVSTALGVHKISLRNLLELRRLHHSKSKLSAEEACDHQSLFMGQLIANARSPRTMKGEISDLVKSHAEHDTKAQKAPIDHSSDQFKVFNSNGRFLLNVVPKGSVNLVVTSPPFAVGKKFDTATNLETHLKNIIPVLQCAAKTLDVGGVMFVNIIDFKLKNELFPYRDLLIAAIMETGLRFVAPAVWSRPMVLRRGKWNLSHHHTEYSLETTVDHFLMFCHRERRDINPEMDRRAKSEVALDAKNRQGKNCSEYDLLRYDLHFPTSPPQKGSGDVEGCNFSTALIDFIIRMYSFEGDVVLDPFAGTATALKIANKRGRAGIGFEVSKAQCELLGDNFDPKAVPVTEADLPRGWLTIFYAWKEVFARAHPEVFEKVIGESTSEAA